MLIGYAKTLAAVLIFGITSTHAQGCNVPPAEAVSVFALTDEFGGDMSVMPFDDHFSVMDTTLSLYPSRSFKPCISTKPE